MHGPLNFKKRHVLWVLGVKWPGHASDHLHIVWRLRINGGIPAPLASWCGQE